MKAVFEMATDGRASPQAVLQDAEGHSKMRSQHLIGKFRRGPRASLKWSLLTGQHKFGTSFDKIEALLLVNGEQSW
jgi:hypothetical protein